MYLKCRLFSFDLISRIGSNEVMGCCALGPKHVGLGRDHWFEMLENPRKPVAQWYTLQEHVPFCTNESTMGKCRLNCQGQSRQSTVDSSEGSLYGWQESKYWESLTGLKGWRYVAGVSLGWLGELLNFSQSEIKSIPNKFNILISFLDDLFII